jgi:hypothetical protein
MSALVGRAREICVLGELIDRAHERGSALILKGEAGIGKSALLAVMATRGGDRGMVCLTTWGAGLRRSRVASDLYSSEADFDKIKTVRANAMPREGRRRPTMVRNRRPLSVPAFASSIEIR